VKINEKNHEQKEIHMDVHSWLSNPKEFLYSEKKHAEFISNFQCEKKERLSLCITVQYYFEILPFSKTQTHLLIV